MKIEWKFDKSYVPTKHIVKDLYIDGRKVSAWIALWDKASEWRGASKSGVHMCSSEEEATAIALALYILEEQ